ncbi:uncharacterized protein LOC116178458 [Photinus pyralis]|uniref:uncharacterized protein LOC116164890 n=1 Tax=Photinus pyralis TaxID=7054 RepID=UPI0012671B7B|nr:uncharacterized protein LOC116164890 [Photinus pyralis]XP_031353813.1 uncharacterized protein LOC116178458 [Photinus pyralis]
MDASDTTQKKCGSINAAQKQTLTDFVFEHKEMYVGKFTATYTKAVSEKLWQEVTVLLNSIPGGPSKDWKLWRKTWIDLKKNTKAKLSRARNYAAGTGGGPPLPEIDTSTDSKILEILSPVCVTGDKDIVESQVILDDEMHPVMDVDMENKYIEVPSVTIDVPCASTSTANDVPTCTPVHERNTPRMKKSSKSARLHSSIANHDKLLKLNQEKLAMESDYKKRKLEILEQMMKDKRSYQEKKIGYS